MTQPNAHKKNISSAALRYEWAHSANCALVTAERAEAALSYAPECTSESARKLSGSYYTPADVADFFWGIFFSRDEVSSADHAAKMLNQCVFVEPSVGAGALFFALVKKLLLLGLSPVQLSCMQVDLIDSNKRALDFVEDQVKLLENAWNVRFENVKFIHEDFRNYKLRPHSGRPIFFGNPPFVANARGISKWRNIFAEFIELSLAQGNGKSSLHFIVPLSLAFSRDYAELRHMLRQATMNVSIASFDNMPDTLFKSGKPNHTNSNKANSQRCSILTVLPAKKTRISATKLHRWSKGERGRLLSCVPEFHDVTEYDLDDQFPRPASESVALYLKKNSKSKSFAGLLSDSTKFRLLVASVARNYIGFRDKPSSGAHELCFRTKEDFLAGLGILSSNLFFEYWLTIGDGFHLTKTNILNFPLASSYEEYVRSELSKIECFWNGRSRFEKVKLNAGKPARSFDFSSDALPLHS